EGAPTRIAGQADPPSTLLGEAELGVAGPIDRARPGEVRVAAVVEGERLEVEQLAVARAADPLRADRPALDRCRVDGLKRGEGRAAVGALEEGLEPQGALRHG